ncbi:MAG: HhH-GPD-type base excision DNA repair protein [Actinomycetota bacterium]
MATRIRELPFTADPAANRLLAREPFALLLGMLLDQQVPMEWAFSAPALLAERMGGTLTPVAVAELGPDALEELFRAKPALHRYPGSMARRAHALAVVVVEQTGGRTERLWTGVATGTELLARLRTLPGFGPDKARIFVGVLGKRLGVRPDGWETVAADWPSIADVDRFERVLEIREAKRAAKAAKTATAEKSTAKKAIAEKSTAKKSVAEKSVAKKATAKKSAAK